MSFEEQMQLAQTAHLNQDYDMALCYLLAAYDGTGNGIEKGRAARDVAASLDRIGLSEPAVEWAGEAWGLHDIAVEGEEKDALRERAASAMYVGSLALRQAIHLERAGDEPSEESDKALDMLRSALCDIKEYETEHKNGFIDQYRINMTGRVAMAEGLYGSRTRGLLLGANAAGLAQLSESAMTGTYKRSMPLKERLHARFNASVRGAAAMVIPALSFPPIRSLALRIADRTL